MYILLSLSPYFQIEKSGNSKQEKSIKNIEKSQVRNKKFKCRCEIVDKKLTIQTNNPKHIPSDDLFGTANRAYFGFFAKAYNITTYKKAYFTSHSINHKTPKKQPINNGAKRRNRTLINRVQTDSNTIILF